MGFWHLWMGQEGGGTATVLASGEVTIAFSSTSATVTFAGGEIMGCITRLSANACEESTYGITVSFTDEDGDAMTPDTLTWSLYTLAGSVVNSKSGEVVSPDTSVTITLSGDDLAVLTDDNRLRRLTLEGTYSSGLGSGIPLKAECEFRIGDLVGVS